MWTGVEIFAANKIMSNDAKVFMQ